MVSRWKSWLVSWEEAFDEIAQDKAAHAHVGGERDMFPEPSKAAVEAVVFDIGVDGSLSFQGSVRTQGTNPTLLYRR